MSTTGHCLHGRWQRIGVAVLLTLGMVGLAPTPASARVIVICGGTPKNAPDGIVKFEGLKAGKDEYPRSSVTGVYPDDFGLVEPGLLVGTAKFTWRNGKPDERRISALFRRVDETPSAWTVEYSVKVDGTKVPTAVTEDLEIGGTVAPEKRFKVLVEIEVNEALASPGDFMIFVLRGRYEAKPPEKCDDLTANILQAE